MTTMEPTGIKVLDDLLSGGLPRPSAVGLIGAVGSGKSSLVRQLAVNMLEKDFRVLYYAIELGIHSNSFYNEVRSSFDGVIDLKLDEMDGELRRFVRVYSYRGAHETKWFRLLIGPDRSVKIY